MSDDPVTEQDLQFLEKAIAYQRECWTEYEHGGYFAFDKFATIERLPATIRALQEQLKAAREALELLAEAEKLLKDTPRLTAAKSPTSSNSVYGYGIDDYEDD